MFLYNGKWSRGNNISNINTIEGSIELKDGEILVNCEGKSIFNGTILSSKFDEEYISVYCHRFLSNGVGNARFGLVSSSEEDIKIVSEVKIEAIKEVKFNISNFDWWLGGSGISSNENGEIRIRENIEIFGEEIFIETRVYYDKEKYIESIPFINIVYNIPVSLERVEKDINSITKFFAILMGRVDRVQEVWLKLEKNDYYSRYFTATNNSHMREYKCYKMFLRTKYNELPQKLSDYYASWCRLYDKYYIVIEHFFKLNIGIPISYEDMFLDWCNIFDGYMIHKNKTDTKTNKFGKAIKKILKMPEIEKIFTEEFKKFDLEFEAWKVANRIKLELELGKSLGERLQILFKENCDLISKNIDDLKSGDEDINEENIYEYINKTRNYYTHLKEEKEGILNNRQICEMNKLFCCTFIIILLKEIGFEGEELKKILDNDEIITFYKI